MPREFNDLVDGWETCGLTLTMKRWERARAVAKSKSDHATLGKLDKQMHKQAENHRRVMGYAESMIIQTNCNHYVSELIDGRWQIMATWTGGTFYIVDHSLQDLVVMDRDQTARFPSIESAKAFLRTVTDGIQPVTVALPITVKPLREDRPVRMTSDVATQELPFDLSPEERLSVNLPGDPVTDEGKAMKAKAKAKIKAGPKIPQPVTPKQPRPPRAAAPMKAAKPAEAFERKTGKASAKFIDAKPGESLVLKDKKGKAVAVLVPTPTKAAKVKPPKRAYPVTYERGNPERITVGTRTADLIMEGGRSVDQIRAILMKEYPERANSESNVRWYVSWLARQGVKSVPPFAPKK